ARQVLRAASVFGEVFWEGGVAALLGERFDRNALSAWLARLEDQEEVVATRETSRFADEPELVFRHALVREGASAMITAEDARLGHLLTGEWLEQHGETDALVLAEHFERGGEGARAGGFYRLAAEQALRTGDTASAAAAARLGLACAGTLELRS